MNHIGCQYHSIVHWIEHRDEIGKDAGYSDSEIKNYMGILRDLK